MSKRSEQQTNEGKLFWENVLRLKIVLRLKSPRHCGQTDRLSPLSAMTQSGRRLIVESGLRLRLVIPSRRS